MKNEIKILKFLYNAQKAIVVKEVCEQIHLNYDEKAKRIFRHLINQQLVTLHRNDGRVGTLLLEIDPVAITTSGIKHLENRIPFFIKTYVPIFISFAALAIAIMALVRTE